MTLGSPPVKIQVALQYGGVWNDESVLVYKRDPISITRGAPNEATTADPSSVTATLNNRDYRFCARNPNSPLFGLIGRNTPLRVRAGLRLSDNFGLALPQESTTDSATTPDNAALDIVGDIDIAVEFTAFSVLTGTQCLIGKGTFVSSGTQLSYQVLLGVSAGVPHVTLRWSTDGSTQHFVDHPMAALGNYKHMAVRVTLDVNNGASGNTASFYTSSDGTINGSWTLDGSATVTSGVTSIFSGSGVLAVGAQSSGNNPFRGIIFAALVKNGIAGTSVANPNFDAQTAGSTGFTDAAGRVWTLAGGSYIDYYLHTRMVVEVSSWPQMRDISGTDIYTQITGGGVLRRLQQGQNVPTLDPMTAYLDGAGPAVAFVGSSPSDTTGKKTLSPVGNPGFAYGGGDLGFGDKVLQLTPAASNDQRDANGYLQSGYLTADISNGSGSHFAAGLVFQADAGNLGDLGLVVTSFDDGIISREFELQIFGAFGFIFLIERAYNRVTTATVVTTLLQVYNPVLGPNTTGYGDGLKHSAYFTLDQSGADVAWQVYIDAVSIGSGTATSINLKTLWQLHLSYDAVDGDAVDVGYISAFGGTTPSAVTFNQPATGYLGETAADRIIRIATADSISAASFGVSASTMLLGAQSSKGVLELIQEAAASDGGFLGDQRSQIGLTYIPRAYLYNQTPQVVLDYSTHIFSGDPAPTDDDQNIHNDVTASNASGGSAEQILETGALSVQPPPAGINTYATTVSVNVASDGFLDDIARWALARGTVDKPRWPAVPLSMLSQHLTTQLYNQIADAGLTNLIQISKLPLPLPPDTVNLLLLGDQETIAQDQWDMKWNLVPADPFMVGVIGTNSRGDAENSTTHAGGFTSSALSASIDSAANTQPWTTDSGAFPVDVIIAGEQITVSNITGATSPQTFTFSARSVNGVVKAHVGGESVHLATPTRLAL